MLDYLQRFIFTEHGVRGVHVRLHDSLQTILTQHAYQAPITGFLSELLVANCLLASTLKFEGLLTIQLNSQGPIKMLVAKCNDQLQIRGLAKTEDDASSAALSTDFAGGQLVVTIQHQLQQYQSIVPIERRSIAHALEDYFVQSEQLATRLYLAPGQQQAYGLLLQVLPDTNNEAGWQHLTCLSDTLTAQELQTFSTDILLSKLFHAETFELYPAQAIEFACSCSTQKMQNAIRTLGRDAAYEELKTHRYLHVVCDFCNQSYDFDRAQLDRIFSSN